MRLSRLFSALLLLLANSSFAQETPIGYWTSHFPYHSVVSIATDGHIHYAASELSFFTHDPATGETEAYSKVDGMSDVDMAWVAYDKTTGITILTYKNGNIDLFKDRSFYNVPDFKQRVINGPKNINGIYTENGLAYLSTSVGIIVVNLEKKEIKETYEFAQNQINIPIFGFSGTTDFFYASTLSGIYRISRNNPSPQVFTLWQKISGKVLPDIAVAGNKVFLCNSDSLFVVDGDTLKGIRNLEGGGDHLDEGNGNLLISRWSAVEVMRPSDFWIGYTAFFRDAKQAAMRQDGAVWVADFERGIAKGAEAPIYISPNGPSGPDAFDIYAHGKNVLVAHGSTDDKWIPYGFNMNGFSEFKEGQWISYNSRNYAPLDTLRDFITITKDRSDGTIYAGSYRDGLFILKADGTHQLLRQNSPIEVSGPNGTWSVASLAIDASNTLWVTAFGGATAELYAKTSDNTWYKFNTPFSTPFPNSLAGLVIDDIGQKWAYSPLGGGVIVYNDNGTLDDKNDDTYRQLLAGEGAGNLPNNDVYSLARDKNNAIWIGTRAGIGIVNCADQVTTTQCDAERPIVQFDQFAGYLFETEIVYAIAVDGANRKWVGTGNGVWLLSPSGDKIVYRFTAENSPLPSNLIKKITIDPVTGDVYIGTGKGMVCYRSTATDGGETNDDQLITFPNPVPSGYSGTIAIKGLVENADVRITDISGQLIYRTTAFGGQAVWNGMDYKGRRPQSGVYLVFASNKDGTETATGKIVFRQ